MCFSNEAIEPGRTFPNKKHIMDNSPAYMDKDLEQRLIRVKKRVFEIRDSQKDGVKIPCTNIREQVIAIEYLISREICDKEAIDAVWEIVSNCKEFKESFTTRAKTLRDSYYLKYI